MKIINVKERKVIQITKAKQIPVSIIIGFIAILASLLLCYMLLTKSNPITDLIKIGD